MRHFALERDGDGKVARMVWMGDTGPDLGAPTPCCGFCGVSLDPPRYRGHLRRFCSPDHRQAAYERDHPRLNSGQKRIEFTPTASRVSAKRESKRERMLRRLESGPARCWELMAIGGSGFSSRLSELRRDHRIRCDEDEQGGLYTLEPE